MKLNARIGGRDVTIVDIQRGGSIAYVHFIDHTATPPALLSVQFSTSALADNQIAISTSATWLG